MYWVLVLIINRYRSQVHEINYNVLNVAVIYNMVMCGNVRYIPSLYYNVTVYRIVGYDIDILHNRLMYYGNGFIYN